MGRERTFLALANFMGNDYIRRIKSVGGNPVGKAGQLAKTWADLPNEDAKEAFLNSFNWGGIKNYVYCKQGEKVENYADRFNLAMNIFLHCPVFKRLTSLYYIAYCRQSSLCFLLLIT